MKKFIFLLLFLSPFVLNATVITIDIQEGTNKALAFSKKRQATQGNYAAAMGRAQSLKSENWPQLFLDGQYRRLEHISSMTLPAPINKTIELGNKNNYSAGINLSYLITDFGQTEKSIEGAQEEAKAEAEVVKLTEAQIEQSLKNVFHKILFQSSQLRALLDAWNLALEQERDVQKRFSSGTSSRLDYVNATKETLSFKLKFLQTQREFSSTLQDWFTLTGESLEEESLRSPLPENLLSLFSNKATAWIRFVLPNDTDLEERYELNAIHPSFLQLEHLKLSQEYKSKAVERSYFPRLSFGARSSIEYPDSSKAESYHQNSIFVTLTMPLWDGGKRSGQKDNFFESSNVFEYQKENLKNELTDSVRKMNQTLFQLKEEIVVAKEGMKDAETLAKLTYQSYRNGQSNFLQVQSANLKVLEWKTQVDSLLYARSIAKTQLEFLGVKK